MIREIVFLQEAFADLEAGRRYYNQQTEGVGSYFSDSIIADIESLSLFHGFHRVQFGCHRMLARSFPFGIYYRDFDAWIQVVAILDLRQRPSWLRSELRKRNV